MQRQSFTSSFQREIELAQQVDQMKAKLTKFEEMKQNSLLELDQRRILEQQLKKGFDVNLELSEQCKELKRENRMLTQMVIVKNDTANVVAETQKQLTIQL